MTDTGALESSWRGASAAGVLSPADIGVGAIERPAAPLSALEIAAGMPFGSLPVQWPPSRHSSPQSALEDSVRAALAREPCLVAFSGGRDSSALLAVAVDLARREGLSPPVPVTLRFASSASREDAWQEFVLRHLDVRDWIRLDCGAELDMVGPTATEGLLRHGLLYPANAHLVVPMARAASGGSLLTGLGGDDVFGNWPWHEVAGALAGRRPPQARDLRRAVHLGAPQCLRAEILRRREPFMFPWIVDSWRHRVAKAISQESTGVPRTWSSRLWWLAGWRLWREMTRSLGLLAAEAGASVVSPFLEPTFLDALAQAGGRWGWGSRTTTMRAVFGDLLPEAALSRTSKAEFGAALFGAHTQRFAEEWSGDAGGLDGVVDADALRRVWRSDTPHFCSATLLQACWLRAQTSRAT